MKILLLSSRFPWPAYTGDRLRATIWLDALEREGTVSLVAPDGRIPPGAPRFRFHAAKRSPISAIGGVLRVVAGAPLQSLLAAPFDWSDAIARAERDIGPFDVAIVLLSRLDPAVRNRLRVGFRILDAVDSLGRSMDERARESGPLMRRLWRAESRRVARLEADAALAYDRPIVVSAEDAAGLDAVAISNGVTIAPLANAPRPIDFAFWGRLAYFANRDAAEWLLDEIWPAIRARRPEATLLVGGADVPARIRSAHGRDGIRVQSPVDDVAALARSVKVALFPVRYGTGQSNKVLEAAEGGCAIVATSKAMRGLALPALTADDASGLANAAINAISDEAKRAAMATALRAAVETHYARRDTLARLAAVVQRAEAAA